MAVTSIPSRRVSHIVWLISVAHLLSHLYQLALPPLFPLIRADLGLSYAELGAALAVFSIATGVFQTPVGFLCERIGARPVLVGGLLLNAVALILLVFVDSLWPLLFLMVLAGIGNSVFHPADYSILSAVVDSRRIGRAFALHSFGGSVGFAVAPILMVALAAWHDWRFAVAAIGLMGVALAFVLLLFGAMDEGKPSRSTRDDEHVGWWQLVTSPSILRMFLFYTGAAAANAGIYYFAAAALVEMYDIDLAFANIVVASFMVASMVAVLPGGWLADNTTRHTFALVVAFGVSGLLSVVVAFGVPLVLAIALICCIGALRGLVIATRDSLVRHAAPAASVGTVFAFVTTGFMVGQTISPLLYGVALDLGSPNLVFLISAGFSLLCLAAAPGRRSKASKQTRAALGE